MRLLITGATGLIGSHLIPALDAAGYEIWLWVRSPDKARALWPHLPAVAQLTLLPAPDTFDVIINLAGEPIAASRWSQARKHVLCDSRIALTQSLCEWLASAPRKGRLLLSGSAVGIYGNTDNRITDEHAVANGADFASQLCRDWESAAQSQKAAADRVILLRTGLVLSPAGGILKQMQLPFRLGLGGHLGSGNQYLPWIHHRDYVNALLFLLRHPSLTGPINLCAPNPVNSRAFSQTLARHLSRPCLLPAPAWVLKTMLGELSDLLLFGQRCIPAVLMAQGFGFEFENLSQAMQDLL